MGLTSGSTGRKAVDEGLVIHRETPQDRVIALAGNPNVGKSTVFNGLTRMNQHTGNWPGKTVANAQGRCEHGGRGFVMVDIPGRLIRRKKKSHGILSASATRMR